MKAVCQGGSANGRLSPTREVKMNTVSSTHTLQEQPEKSKTINEKVRGQRGSWQVRFVAAQTNGSRIAAGADDDLALRSGVYFMDTDSHTALSWMAGGSRLGLRLMSGPSLAPVRSNRLSKMSPVAAGDEAGIRQKGERQAAEQATSWVQAASQSWLRRRDLRMEQQKLAQ